MMQIPQSAASFAAYTGIVTSAIRQAMGTAHVVVVVFDDPAHMTEAKREEQMRRDANRKKTQPVCSVDIVPYPTNDAYGVAELTGTSDCHAIVKCRASRQRFFDETGRQVLANLNKSISSWEQSGAKSVVIFDGLDPRGATRPHGAPRETKIYGSDPEWDALFQRDFPIGEGDLKLAWVEQRVRDLAEEQKLDTRLHMSCTIDTDSIAIELLDEARRQCQPDPEHPVMGVLCMRERAQKRDECDDDAKAVYWCVDYAHLLRLLQAHMWGRTKEPSLEQQRKAMTMMAAGWALAGCDFVRVPGLTAAMVFDAMPSYLSTAPELVDLVTQAWSGDRARVKEMTPAFRRLLLLCAGNYEDQPRARKATVAKMREYDAEALLRASWTVSYWNQCEFTGALRDFGFSMCVSKDIVASTRAVSMPPPPPMATGSRFFAAEANPGDRLDNPMDLEAVQ